MLKLDRSWIEGVRKAANAEDLRTYLQKAIELEHATIPPYLTAYFTLKDGTNRDVADIIHGIVIQEMFHMTIAANTLIAVGGSPQIDHPDFIPTYPGPLPMNIGDGLIVRLRKLSREQVHDVFMEIEEPEDPLDFPVETAHLAAPMPEYGTIGEFYHAVIEKIQALGDGIFTGDPKRQVKAFSQYDVFPIKDVKTATKALDTIIREGEGTSSSPIGDPEMKDIAHYYRFAEIYHGRRLVKDPDAKEGYSYSGAPVTIDADGVWDMQDNPKAANYPEGSRSRRLADQFNYSYTKVLRGLHRAFNGEPDTIGHAIGTMFEVRTVAQQVLAEPAPDGNGQTGLPFEYAPLND